MSAILAVSSFGYLLTPRATAPAQRACVSMSALDGKVVPTGGMASVPKVGVLAVQGGFRAHIDAVERQGCVQGVEVRSAEDLEGLDALILPGGESTAQGHALVKADMLEPVREFAAAKPTWGVCAGMILLADELAGSAAQPLIGGLKVTVERNAFGRQIDSRYRSMELSEAAKQSELGDAAYFIRAPLVAKAGEGVEVLATVPGEDETKVAAVRQDKMLATCFHPEISSDDSWLQYFLSEVRLRPAPGLDTAPPLPPWPATAGALRLATPTLFVIAAPASPRGLRPPPLPTSPPSAPRHPAL